MGPVWREGGGAAVQDVTLYLLYILQAAGVWLQGGGVLHHLVHCDDQEDEIELSEESNGSVNTRRCAHRPRGSQNTVNLSMSIKRGGGGAPACPQTNPINIHRWFQPFRRAGWRQI